MEIDLLKIEYLIIVDSAPGLRLACGLDLNMIEFQSCPN